MAPPEMAELVSGQCGREPPAGCADRAPPEPQQRSFPRPGIAGSGRRDTSSAAPCPPHSSRPERCRRSCSRAARSAWKSRSTHRSRTRRSASRSSDRRTLRRHWSSTWSPVGTACQWAKESPRTESAHPGYWRFYMPPGCATPANDMQTSYTEQKYVS